MSRLFTGYASATSANQVQPVRVRRSQTRTLAVDFRAVLNGSEVASVTWECTHPESTSFGTPVIAEGGQSVSVPVTFNFPGFSHVKATALAEDGQVFGYEFACDVLDAPMYPTATYPAAGPYSVEAP
jgi:hypothetical protein